MLYHFMLVNISVFVSGFTVCAYCVMIREKRLIGSERSGQGVRLM